MYTVIITGRGTVHEGWGAYATASDSVHLKLWVLGKKTRRKIQKKKCSQLNFLMCKIVSSMGAHAPPAVVASDSILLPIATTGNGVLLPTATTSSDESLLCQGDCAMLRRDIM